MTNLSPCSRGMVQSNGEVGGGEERGSFWGGVSGNGVRSYSWNPELTFT